MALVIWSSLTDPLPSHVPSIPAQAGTQAFSVRPAGSSDVAIELRRQPPDPAVQPVDPAPGQPHVGGRRLAGDVPGLVLQQHRAHRTGLDELGPELVLVAQP